MQSTLGPVERLGDVHEGILAQLQQSGIWSDEESAAMKAKILQ